ARERRVDAAVHAAGAARTFLVRRRRPGMKLIVVTVGARMPAWVDEAWKDYAKRLPPACALELREVKPEPRTSGKTPAQMMAAEARRIEAVLPPACHRVALAERG